MTTSPLKSEIQPQQTKFEAVQAKAGNILLGASLYVIGIGVLGFVPLSLFMLSLAFCPEYSTSLSKTAFGFFAIGTVGFYFFCLYNIFFADDRPSDSFLTFLVATAGCGYSLYYCLAPFLK